MKIVIDIAITSLYNININKLRTAFKSKENSLKKVLKKFKKALDIEITRAYNKSINKQSS